MNKSVLTIIIVVVLLVAGGAFALTRQDNKAKPSTTVTNTSDMTPAKDSVPSTETPASTSSNQANTVSYNNDGFSPSSLTVKSGTTVTIKNDSNRVLQFNSDPHPEHTDNDELNAGSISPGSSGTIKATKAGTHKFHNHLNDDHAGTLVVE